MTQEQKELLLIDLCARLPYGVKAYIKNWSKIDRKYYEGVYTVNSVYPSLNSIYGSTEKCGVEVILGYSDYFIRPYLFPLSSMTEEQKKEEYEICKYYLNGYETKLIDFYHKNHLDHRGLIPMGLALDATGLGIYP